MPSRRFFSLRYKLIIAFLIIGALLSGVLSYVSYHILEQRLFYELKRSVGNITEIGVETLDKEALKILIAQQGEALDLKRVDEVEKSSEFIKVTDQLNRIRDTEKSLIRYIYLVTPTDDSNRARFLVDADVITDKIKGEKEEDISHYNLEIDISEFPLMRKAFEEKTREVEDEYVYDEAYRINTVSGYAPVFDADGKTMLAVLGLDMSNFEVQAALKEVTNTFLGVSAIALVSAIIIAVLMGTWVTAGIIKLDNLVTSFAQKNFSVRSNLKSNDEVGRLGFSFNHMAETIQEYNARLEKLVDAYGRFVPHDLLKMLDKKSILDVSLGDQVQKDMAVLFSDIRDFTSLSETMNPKDNFNFLNSYLGRIGPEIRSHNGIIDKYIGDAVMGLFPNKSDDAVEAALAIQEKIIEFNVHRAKYNLTPVKAGVSIHSGKVMLGTLGEMQRMDGTVISDTVNVASRIESLTKKYASNIIISDAAMSALSNPDRYFIRYLDKVYVPGKIGAVVLHEICNADGAKDLESKKRTYADYSEGVERYYTRDFTGAETLFQGVLAENANDIPARIFLEKTQEFIKSPPPSDWDGVTKYYRKN
ncbi:MAG TPA: hypothetical protein DEA55_03005 [Rhodospirillaceae bacterium]|nr:hypothetical protein [Rhodospirillaceae bacterium]